MHERAYVSCALVIVDVQNDFCEGGSLAVEGGVEVAASITALVDDPANADRWSSIVCTRDWHVDPGDHWATDEAPNLVTTWPVHCRADSPGAAFHPALQVAADEIFSKGEYGASYSGFEGSCPGVGDDAGDRGADGMSLVDWLRSRQVTSVELVGLATDHCVRATALDAVTHGFATTVLLGQCAGVAPETTQTALASMAAAGVVLID